jgi:hypothetical protein
MMNNLLLKNTISLLKVSTGLMLLLLLSSFQEKIPHNNLKGNITPQQIRSHYTETTKERKYPRLFFNETDITRIKALLDQKDPIITLGYQQLKKTATEVLSDTIMTYRLDEAKLRVKSIHTFASQVPSLVMMYQLTKDTIYANRAWKQLAEFSTYPDWGANRHFLDAGIGGFDFAIAYDGLSDYLSKEQKEIIKKAVLENVLMPAKKQMENNVWWHTADHNWNGICNGGMVMAALAMYEDDPETMSQIIALAANALPLYINAFEPDGQSVEGVKYWSYGLMYTTIALESMQRVLGTTFGIDDTQGFKKTGWFPVYVSGPVTSLSVGDDPIKNKKEQTFFWFAKRFNDSALAKLQYDLCLENKNVTWADMVYYNPEMVKGTSKLNSIPKDNYIQGISIMSMRENWKPDALYVAMHGGSNNANHGHLDAGTFEIQGLGEVWAYSDLGSDDYTFPGYFTKVTKPEYRDEPAKQTEPGRWHFYRLRAEGKNCIVLNSDERPDQNPLGEAKLIANKSTDDEGFYSVDLTDCYKRDVLDYRRGIKLDRQNKVITIQDELKPKKGSKIYWSMHTMAVIDIAKDGQTAILKMGNKQLKASIVGLKEAKFTVLPATYLQSQSFPLTKNSVNKGFRKLAIQLNSSEPVTLRIDFSPLAQPSVKQKINELKNW